jgi:hypothetical protein
MGGVGAKVKRVDTPSLRRVVEVLGMFPSAVYPKGTPSKVKEKLALKAGSSKHTKAWRAEVASNWVATMKTVPPLSSV